MDPVGLLEQLFPSKPETLERLKPLSTFPGSYHNLASPGSHTPELHAQVHIQTKASHKRDSALDMIHIHRRFVLQLEGFVMVAVGLSAAVMAPLEFSLFKDITKDLVGFGYLGFAAHSCQIFGFYLVALVLIPLGYGHLLLRSWTHKLSLTALWSWLILGIPCMALVMYIFVAYKDPTDFATLVFGAFTLFIYPVLPFALVLFYRSSETQAQFHKPTNHLIWIETAPQPVLILGSVVTFYVFAFHSPLFLNGVVPFGCGFLSGLRGYALAATAILGLSFVALGLFNQRRWAWFGGVACFTTMAVDFPLAFLCSSFDRVPPTAWRVGFGRVLGRATISK